MTLMNGNKRIGRLAVIGIVSMALAGNGLLATGQVSAEASGFKDVPQSHWAYDTVMWSKANGVSDGYPDGSFRPGQAVTEAEFLAMLLRVYPGVVLPEATAGEVWYGPYYRAVNAWNWPVYKEPTRQVTRGQVAQLLAAITGQALGETEAVRFVLEQGLAKGKPGVDGLEGYAPKDVLSRAEAQTFLYRLKQMKPEVSAEAITLKEKPGLAGQESNQGSPAAPEGAAQPQESASSPGDAGGTATQTLTGMRLQGIAIGDSTDQVIRLLGEPDRKDEAAAGMLWYIYNKDAARYAQIGVKEGRVVALFSNGKGWQFATGDTRGLDGLRTTAAADKLWGKPVNDADYFVVYETGDNAVYLYVDKYEAKRVDGVLVIDKAFDSTYRFATPERTGLRAMERQVLDLANTFRAAQGVNAVSWSDKAAKSAQLHSEDMVKRNYFDHRSPEGSSAGDRMKAQGTGALSIWGENIAVGYTDAIDAHYGWVNSMGHRTNMLKSSFKYLGVGVADGGDSGLYYTQNFYTPL
ncbi:CAP domain-containing protein [Paenibacillus phocaensis]|uniref:CAP domain-containing protein n=1 Tax=Paenibacillus phocaensis TaxID=1776378 RepID=UPI000839D283|nr:CAP domain-containing protein [Paenibacillus phocaensis]